MSRTVDRLGLDGRPNICIARGIRSLLGWEPPRFGVLHVRTNSTKFALGHRDEEGTARTDLDTAVVTRLGEGLARPVSFGPEPRCVVPSTPSLIWSTASAGRGSDRDRGRGHGRAAPGLRTATTSSTGVLDPVRGGGAGDLGPGGGPSGLPGSCVQPSPARPTACWSSTPAAEAASSPSGAPPARSPSSSASTWERCASRRASD